MNPEDIYNLLHQRPFVPFRLHLTDGRHFDVRHPEMLFLTSWAVSVGIYKPEFNGKYPVRSELIGLSHVVSLEPLPQHV